MTTKKVGRDLLSQIEHDALDSSADVTAALRRCIALGGQSGSESLREWATRELKGYGATEELPEYRILGAPLAVDGATFHGYVTGQQIRPGALPDPVADRIKEERALTMPISEVVAAIEDAKRKGESIVRMGVPGGSDIVAIMNYEAQQREPQLVQQLTRLYWELHTSSLLRVVDVVRTTLVELVAEIRAATPDDAKPTKAITDQAVNVAIYGDKNRVSLGEISPVNSGGDINSDASSEEPRSQRIVWWLVAIATIVAGVAAVLALIL